MGFSPTNKHQTSSSGLGGAAARKLIEIADIKSAGSSGGTFTSGSWQTRTLNTVETDETGQVILASNQFTLPAGTYEYALGAPAFRVGVHRSRLQNITDATTVKISPAYYSNTNTPSGVDVADSSPATVAGRFTITSSKTFQIQHQCSSSFSTSGLGTSANFGAPERFAEIVLYKVA